MSRNITLNDDKIKAIIEKVFSKEYRDTVIVDALVKMLGDSSLDMFIHIMFNTDYKLLEVGDYVKFKPSKYDFENRDDDIMIDQGIMGKDGYMYGEVLGDTSYSDDFNPTYYKLKLGVLLCDEDKIIMQDYEIKTLDCIKIDSSDIKYNELMNIWNEKV